MLQRSNAIQSARVTRTGARTPAKAARRLWKAGVLAAAVGCAGTAGLAAPAKPVSRGTATASIGGMWLIDHGAYHRDKTLPLTPEGAAIEEKRRAALEQKLQVLTEETRNCLPIGMPGMMTNEFALEVLETPGRVTILSENSPVARTIYLKKKGHPKVGEFGWNGYSTGRWTGKVLTVDTDGFNDRLVPISLSGVHSPTTHLVERLYLKDPDTLIDEMTFEDPKYLTRPWTTSVSYHRIKNDAELWEYVCEVDAPGWSQRYSGEQNGQTPAKPQ